jgi:hypothetical protein
MPRFGRTLLVAGIFGWVGVLGLNPAGAAPIIPVLESVTPEGALFRWTYQVAISDNERIQATANTPTSEFPSNRPDFLVIYDFLGFAGGAIAPAGWDFTSPNSGPFPDNLGGLSDDAAVPNLVFTRSGGTLTGPADLGTFSVLSTLGQVNPDGVFAGETTQNTGPLDNTNLVNAGTTPVPTPEPATILLVLAGPLFLFGAVKCGLRRKQQSAGSA